MKALVTGGNGFLGRCVVAALQAAGARVRVLDVVRREGAPDVEQLTADLTTSDALEAAFAGVDVVVHLAASLRGSDAEVVHNTVEGSRRLFEAMARTPTSRIVLASSFSVYDWSKLGDSLDEHAPTLNAATARTYGGYAEAKTLQEHLARDHARRHGWTLTVLRPAVLWGRGVWGEFLLGRRLGPLQLVVAPLAPIRLVYVENAADAFVRAAERVVGGERICNVIDPPELTTWRYAGIVQRHHGGIRVPLPYLVGVGLARLAGLAFRGSGRRFEALHKPVRCSAREAGGALGWKPPFAFDAALARAEAPHA